MGFNSANFSAKNGKFRLDPILTNIYRIEGRVPALHNVMSGLVYNAIHPGSCGAGGARGHDPKLRTGTHSDSIIRGGYRIFP